MLNIKDIIDRYNKGEHMEFVFFWGGYLSNWFVSSFEIEGVRYFCVEQYMMAMKAKVFNDLDVLQKIMQSTDQREIKRLGRQVKNYNDEIWAKERIKIVFDGNYAKFTQKNNLKNYLLNTGDKILVEASPSDTIWGIGMDKEETGVSNPNNWDGTNYLGFTLMEVRDVIKHNTNNRK